MRKTKVINGFHFGRGTKTLGKVERQNRLTLKREDKKRRYERE